jgi:hypothetical protein
MEVELHTGIAAKRAGRNGQIDLAKVMFSASIDYVKVETPGRVALPPLDGSAKFSRQEHYRVLTVHDASGADVATLAGALGDVRIIELEVAVDVVPRPWVRGSERLQLLENTMLDLFASGLDPSEAQGMVNQFRAFYRRLEEGYQIGPFNLRLPKPTDQQLHGGRQDDCQVKAYLKRTDQRKALHPDEWVSRVEVRLSGRGLTSRNVHVISDLLGFRFRKQLMPFFTHVKGTRRRKRVTKITGKLQQVSDQWHDRQDQDVFRRHGVGAFKDGGKVPPDRVCLRRDVDVNNRIGQALTRLERQLRSEKIRAFPAPADDD